MCINPRKSVCTNEFVRKPKKTISNPSYIGDPNPTIFEIRTMQWYRSIFIYLVPKSFHLVSIIEMVLATISHLYFLPTSTYVVAFPRVEHFAIFGWPNIFCRRATRPTCTEKRIFSKIVLTP